METVKNYIDQIKNFVLQNKQVTMIIAYGLLLLGCVWIATAIVYYFKSNHIFGLIYANITQNINKRDDLHKKNITADIKQKKNQLFNSLDKKTGKQNRIKVFIHNISKKINSLIFYTGLLNIPGFSTTTMFILLGIVLIIVFTVATIFRGVELGIVCIVAILFFFYYGLDMIKYSRKNKLEGQLLQFINDVTSASLQYVNIIDIFGVIYPNYSDPLRGALQYCYTEAKRTRNQALAMEHLKEKFDSIQFNFIIDNFILCSKTTANYTEVSTNLADTVTIYNTSFEKKKAITRNAKIELIAMFGISLVILHSMSSILPNLYSTLFSTSFGNILLIVLMSIFLYGINIKGERG